MSEQIPLNNLWKQVIGAAQAERQKSIYKSKLRLLGMLLLFDALLIAAVLLSFQEAELVEEVITLQETREVYATKIIEQVITETIFITQVVPYGSRYTTAHPFGKMISSGRRQFLNKEGLWNSAKSQKNISRSPS